MTLLNLQREEGLLHMLREFKSLVRQLRSDAVYTEYEAPGFVPLLAARLGGALCINAAVYQPATANGWRARFLLKVAARLCTPSFCLSLVAERS